MEFIDLHVHSSASDGTLAPGLVTELALEKGEHFHIAVIAILSKLRQRPYQLRGMMVNEEADYMDFFSLIYT